MSKVRYVLLCEDILQERFLRAVCRELGFRELRVERAPPGRGSGAQFVVNRYPREVAALRSKSYQKYLGLVVAIDGDNFGVEYRKDQLDTKLVEDDLEERGKDEKIALEVPTWSIETWLGYLNGEKGLVETERYKRASWLPDNPQMLSELIRNAAHEFVNLFREGNTEADLPSLDDGLDEMRRL